MPILPAKHPGSLQPHHHDGASQVISVGSHPSALRESHFNSMHEMKKSSAEFNEAAVGEIYSHTTQSPWTRKSDLTASWSSWRVQVLSTCFYWDSYKVSEKMSAEGVRQVFAFFEQEVIRLEKNDLARSSPITTTEMAISWHLHFGLLLKGLFFTLSGWERSITSLQSW